MNNGKILIVDDNKSVLSALEILLMSEIGEVKTLANPNRIPSLLKSGNFDLVLLDMNFSPGEKTGNEGLYWLNHIQEIDPEISVVMITAYGDVELAVNALKHGATDFVIKPWDNDKLLATLRSAYKLRLSRLEIKNLRQKEKALKNEINRENKSMVGTSPLLKNVMNIVRKVAGTDTNVLITGENGTGKELIAREIHRLSTRSEEVFICIDLGAVSETLFESELFGHKKGSFTGAHEDRVGIIETANPGTLFLDEIGNLSFPLQSKLLAAIQNREITKLGSTKPIHVDIRLVCATNMNLGQMVKEGKFREDLLYRINTIHIEVPPLRERGEDILALADFFLKRYSNKYGKPGLQISENGKEKLMTYRWPGNIRELQHTIEKAVILSESNVLKPSDFTLKSVLSNEDERFLGTLEDMEKRMIIKIIEINKGNFTTVAKKLGITRQTLYNKIRRYRIGIS